MTQIIKSFFFATLLTLSLSGCVYKITVQQGNLITDQALNQLHARMTADQVHALLGDPLLNNVYDHNNIVYVYTLKQGHQPMTSKRLTIYFVNGRVARFVMN